MAKKKSNSNALFSDGVVDGVMSDLSTVFSPRSRLFARVPLVVLIDDAQFADRDPATAAFVERLIVQSAQERWPLLLVKARFSLVV